MFLLLFLNPSPFLLFLLFHQDTIEHWRSGQIFPHCLDSGISFRVVLRWGRGKALATTCISCALTAQHHASAAKEKPKARSLCFPGLESSNSARYTSKESSQHYYCLKVNTNCSKWNTCQFWNNEQADWNEGGWAQNQRRRKVQSSIPRRGLQRFYLCSATSHQQTFC